MFSGKSVLSALFDHRMYLGYRNFIGGMYDNVRPPALSRTQKLAYRRLWGILLHNPSTKWAEIYQYLTGIPSEYYVADDIYHMKIEPVLNYIPMAKFETSKTRYQFNYPGIAFPPTILSNENGEFYDNSGKHLKRKHIDDVLDKYRKDEGAVIVKPALDSGGGRGVKRFIDNGCNLVGDDLEMLCLDYLDRTYQRDYVVQSVIQQHSFFSQFNPTSVNAIRMYTYRSVQDEDIHVLHSIVKVGGKGSVTNNLSSGGVSIGIGTDGHMQNYAADLAGNKYRAFNDIFLDQIQEVPHFGKLLENAKSLAGDMHYSRIAGVDLCLDNEGNVVVIEVNNYNHGINCYQMSNGPLFGSFTEEIIQYCASHPRSYCFDYLLE